MASTPPPTSLRAHTPPGPMHGPLHDNYEPYSPRRSKRTTAQTNPYGSSNSDRHPKAHLQRATTPPPTIGKRARFASTHFSSPPASPASPRPSALHKTPRKTPVSRALADVLSDSDNTPRRHLPTPQSILPTPSKSLKKRSTANMTSTARILNFQSYSPNDVMPTPRKMKSSGRGQSSRGFDLFDTSGESQDAIPIFTDNNARIPELDGSDDNPFMGPRQKQKQTRRGRVQGRSKTDEEQEMDERAERGEGITYIFRGKKIFRPFQDNTDDDNEHAACPGSNFAQRSLRRQAGPAANRTLTRSSIKPRLLFPNEDQMRERDALNTEDEFDEEALTDIEVPTQKVAEKVSATPKKSMKSPSSRYSHLATPPSTRRTKRTADIAFNAAGLDSVAEESEEVPASPVARKAAKVKNRSPFDDWPRSKSSSSSSKKREAPEQLGPVAGSSKRTRSGVISSPS